MKTDLVLDFTEPPCYRHPMFTLLALFLGHAHAIDLTRRHFLGTTASIIGAAALPAAPTFALPTVAEDLTYRTNVWRLNGTALFEEFIGEAAKLVPEMPGRLAVLERDLAFRFGRPREDVWAEMDEVLGPWRYLGMDGMSGMMWNGYTTMRPARASLEFYLAMLDGLEDIHPDLRYGFGHAYAFEFTKQDPRPAETRVDYWSRHNTILNIASRDLTLEQAVDLHQDYARRLAAVEDQMVSDLHIPRAWLEEAIAYWQHPRQEFAWEHEALRRPRRFPAPPPHIYPEYLARVRKVLPEWADRLDEHLIEQTTNPAYRYRVLHHMNRRQLEIMIADVKDRMPEILNDPEGPVARARRTVEGNEEMEALHHVDRVRRHENLARMREARRKPPTPATPPPSLVIDACIQALRPKVSPLPRRATWQVGRRLVDGRLQTAWPALPKPASVRWSEFVERREEKPGLRIDEREEL